MAKIRLPFIAGDLLHRGAVKGRVNCIIDQVITAENIKP